MTESMSDRGVEVGDTVQMHLISAADTFTCFEGGECETEPAGEVTVTGVLRLDGDLAPGAFSSEGNWLAPAAFADARGGDRVTFGTVTNVFLAPSVEAGTLIADYSPEVDAGDVLDSAADIADAKRAAEIQHDALIIGTAIVAAAGLLIAGQAFGRFLTRSIERQFDTVGDRNDHRSANVRRMASRPRSCSRRCTPHRSDRRRPVAAVSPRNRSASRS